MPRKSVFKSSFENVLSTDDLIEIYEDTKKFRANKRKELQDGSQVSSLIDWEK